MSNQVGTKGCQTSLYALGECAMVYFFIRACIKKMIIQRPKEKCLEIKHISGKEKNTHYFVIPLSKDVGTFW